MAGEIDKDRLRDKLAYLESQLKALSEKQSFRMDEYVRDGDLQAIVERRLYNAVQASIDVAMQIVSEEGPRKPESYGDVFVVLSEMKVIPIELSKRLEEMAGFRNVLAHEYAEIENKEVYKHLQDLEPFKELAQAVSNHYLEKDSKFLIKSA